jgi:hypothetical protein
VRVVPIPKPHNPVVAIMRRHGKSFTSEPDPGEVTGDRQILGIFPSRKEDLTRKQD